MRVVLMHNASAGKEDHSARQLIDEIRRAGHHVVSRVGRRKELAEALEAPCDLVVVAGGDGTVGKAARILAGRTTPMAIVPLGTANNVARSLGIGGDLAEQVAGWHRSETIGYDVATAATEDDEAQFIEAFGYGAFPRVIHQTQDDEDDVGDRLTRDRLLLRARFEASPPRHYRITADGKDLSGDYFMVEILNIPSIGPRIPLAPAASPRDGKLDLVLAGEPERQLLLRGLDRIIAGEDVTIALRSTQVERIRLSGQMRRHHRDGDLVDDESTSLEVTVQRHALRVLAPPAAASSSGSRASSAAL
jgi:diacylglycerol kinase family enzyme